MSQVWKKIKLGLRSEMHFLQCWKGEIINGKKFLCLIEQIDYQFFKVIKFITILGIDYKV
jgi:hypothetical protein